MRIRRHAVLIRTRRHALMRTGGTPSRVRRRPHLPSSARDDCEPGVRREDGMAVAALVAAWVGAVMLVDPRGYVSILDDWCYAISVERILDGHGFSVSPWSSTFPPVLIWWGTLFAWIGG